MAKIFRMNNIKSEVNMKFIVLMDNETEKQYAFHCPGCGFAHSVRVRGPRPRWTVSGVEDDKPTVKPSIRARTGENLCHSFVTDGKIRYLTDSTHFLSGKTVEIPDFDD
jgi:hypothetical protein